MKSQMNFIMEKEEKQEQEPTILCNPHGYFKGAEMKIAPCVKRSAYEANNFVKEPIIGALRGRSEDGTATALTTAHHYSGNIVAPKRGQKEMGVKESNNYGFRIRKLTEREVFRLMDMDDADIDKIQAAGISRSQQYKMAGNSIVVSCLYHIFRKMFVDTEREEAQLTLF